MKVRKEKDPMYNTNNKDKNIQEQTKNSKIKKKT